MILVHNRVGGWVPFRTLVRDDYLDFAGGFSTIKKNFDVSSFFDGKKKSLNFGICNYRV